MSQYADDELRSGPVTRRRRILLVAFALISISAAILLSVATRLTPQIRSRAAAALEDKLRSDVEIGSLQISVFPRPEILGTGLTVRHHGRTDVPPLIRIESYSASAGLLGIMSRTLRLKTVELERLTISIPPEGVRRRADTGTPDATGTPGPSSGSPSQSSAERPRILIDQLVSRAARLEILPRDRTKLPRVFEIHDLVMHGLGRGQGATFAGRLTNPTPRGEITTSGVFGPWNPDEPSLTSLRGEYVFKGANLDTIKGISGILSSAGTYAGTLGRTEVRGETDTPDFALDMAGQPVPLKTRFHAIVDGTNGDTYLERVEARLSGTPVLARGAVVRARDVKGRKLSLDVAIDGGRIEDVLKLAVKGAEPLMTGRMRLKAQLLLPAGDRDVMDKLELKGTFSLERARFSNLNVQERIDTLSRRGEGKTGDDGPSVVSNLGGAFTMRHAVLSFRDLSFAVPGAIVRIAGTYDVRREMLDFRGHLLLDASLAETTTGFKSVLARIAQPLFRRPGGGSKLPIRISGPPRKPEFGLDIRRALGPG